ncbi:thiamine diphosphokinase [Tropicimonas sp. IMCC34043]|uniref:thiamine diphosphokinase n=1 Tax=Tropicimonas sp. IMCC34043 TaxID=2248760 RepID=UPI000E25495E|nr:thiamine diphosphokinase [Tropicimonas sp. IMCC34043]
MNDVIVRSSAKITLLGGSKARAKDLAEALSLAPALVAADGGAATALAQGYVPQAVIGDMDSLAAEVRASLEPEILHKINDQDSTDFDKALRSVLAPLVLGVGFLGRRIDHQLANLNVLVRRADQPCILIGRRDVILAAPPKLTLDLAPGSRVSLFPLAEVTGRSEGLHWPIDGIVFSPAGVIGTSNRVADGARRVRIELDGPGMLLMLPRKALGAAIAALGG